MQVWLEVEGVLCAVVTLGSPGTLEAVRVATFSDEERAEGRAGGWGTSDHAVHRCHPFQTRRLARCLLGRSMGNLRYLATIR